MWKFGYKSLYNWYLVLMHDSEIVCLSSILFISVRLQRSCEKSSLVRENWPWIKSAHIFYILFIHVCTCTVTHTALTHTHTHTHTHIHIHHVTDLLVVDLRLSLARAYFVMTHFQVSCKLHVKTLVAKQLPTKHILYVYMISDTDHLIGIDM